MITILFCQSGGIPPLASKRKKLAGKRIIRIFKPFFATESDGQAL
jgi:hypothetical protein